jgi:hypothetical protein
MKNKKSQLFNFVVCVIVILFLLNFSGCSSPTETPKGNLTGIVNLEDLSNHTGIIIALYDLAYLDTTIVRINNQYPQIGVHINQHTEFDHRLQSPVKTTETLADGSFELAKIPTGIYNFVAIKDGWGFKYLYEIEVIEGDNNLNDVIPLYEEIRISGDISGNIAVDADHHLIIDDDTDFIPSSSLVIEPGAIIRINPGVDLTIHGNLIAQGEENNMFWVTSNDGFIAEMRSDKGKNFSNFTLSRSRSSIELYNYMELSSFVNVPDYLVEWGKWDYANTCLLNKVNNLQIQNGIVRNSGCGFKSMDVDSTFCNKLLIRDCLGENGVGMSYLNINKGIIDKLILLSCNSGIRIKENNITKIQNTYFSQNTRSIINVGCSGDIEHNIFSNNEYDIVLIGSYNSVLDDLLINFNELYSPIGITTSDLPYYSNYYNTICANNNFANSDWYVYISYSAYAGIINCENNYFRGYSNIEMIEEMIYDSDDNMNYVIDVIINGISINKIANAGIQ